MDGKGLVIISRRPSTSTFGATNAYTHNWKLAKKEKEKRRTERRGQPNHRSTITKEGSAALQYTLLIPRTIFPQPFHCFYLYRFQVFVTVIFFISSHRLLSIIKRELVSNISSPPFHWSYLYCYQLSVYYLL